MQKYILELVQFSTFHGFETFCEFSCNCGRAISKNSLQVDKSVKQTMWCFMPNKSR